MKSHGSRRETVTEKNGRKKLESWSSSPNFERNSPSESSLLHLLLSPPFHFYCLLLLSHQDIRALVSDSALQKDEKEKQLFKVSNLIQLLSSSALYSSPRVCILAEPRDIRYMSSSRPHKSRKVALD